MLLIADNLGIRKYMHEWMAEDLDAKKEFILVKFIAFISPNNFLLVLLYSTFVMLQGVKRIARYWT